MRKRRELILGIGHKIKSVENPDKRVVIVIDFVKKNFKSTKVRLVRFLLDTLSLFVDGTLVLACGISLNVAVASSNGIYCILPAYLVYRAGIQRKSASQQWVSIS